MSEPETKNEITSQTSQPSVKPEIDQTISFIWQSHSHLSEVIRNCDIKASLVLAWTTALIGGLFTIEFHHLVVGTHSNLNFSGWKVITIQLGALGSLLLLSAGFAFATFAVAPRYQAPIWGSPEPGYIFWKSILAHGSKQALHASLKTATVSDHLRHLSDHLFTIAKIADIKHSRATVSLWLAASGSVIAGAISLIA